MGGKVIDINERRETQHVAGIIHCTHCKNEWTGVATVGIVTIECPKCSLYRGVFKGTPMPTDKMAVHCECGNPLFFITPDGEAQCCYCAETKRIEDI